MTRAGETGLPWTALFSLYVLILSLLLCCVLFDYVPLLLFVFSTWPTGSDVSYVAIFDGCSMIDSWSCINPRVLFSRFIISLCI